MKKPVFLVDIEYAFGKRIISNEEIEKKYNLPEGWILEKTKKIHGHAWDSFETPTDISVTIFDSLVKKNKVDIKNIKAIFGTTNPIRGENTSLTQQFADKSGLNSTPLFDEGFGCGGIAVGVDAMCSWFDSQPDNTYAVYVTQDWPTKMVEDRNVEALFSDAVSVSIWSNSNGLAKITDVFSDKSNMPDETLGIIDGFWKMDGGEVSRLALMIPQLVADKLNLKLEDYIIAPHQPNAKLLETLEKKYGLPFFKKTAEEHGNPTCSGAFVALEEILKSEETEKDVLVIPFGAGGMGGFVVSKRF